MSNSFVVTFKTPDAISDAIDAWAKCQTCDIEDEEGRDEKYFELRKKANELADQFTRYGEYISVEFNLEKQTVTVV